MFPGLDLYYTQILHNLTTAHDELDDLDDVDDGVDDLDDDVAIV